MGSPEFTVSSSRAWPLDFAIYRKQPVDYAQQLNEACAGGITMGLLTGFAGIGSGWPGSSGLAGIGIGDFWTTAWPQWRDWTQLSDYFARSTLVLETGKPQVDVVIYLDKGIAGAHELTTPKFASAKLESAGFTYDFVDPVSLAAPQATQVAGVLFGNGPAYRALVLNDEPNIPAETAQTILTAAKAGLTVIIIGKAPSSTTGLRDAAQQDAAVAQAMSELIKLDTVATVASPDEVAGALIAHGVRPAASFGESSALLSIHRKTDQDEDLWWVFNPSSDAAAVTASFVTTGTPYQLDLWNGTSARVARWKKDEGRLATPLELTAHGTTVFMFQHQGSPLHVVDTTAEGASYDGDVLVLGDTKGGAKDVTLSDGSSKTLQLASPPAPIVVRDWTLAVDEISPSGNAKHSVKLPELQDWQLIAELKSAVGSGTYTADVDVPASLLNADTDLLIDVGGVAGAMQLSVNGTLVTKQTTPGGKWSVRKLLKAGTNAIAVRLDTTLLNRMAATAGAGSTITPAPSGLLGPVQLIPVALARVQ